MVDFYMYIDESYRDEGRYICLAGAAVQKDRGEEMNQSISTLKSEYFGDKNFNLKGIRREKYPEGEKWKNLSEKEKNNFMGEFFSILCASRLTLIVSLIDKEKMNNIKRRSLYAQAYSFLAERFEYLLDELNAQGSIIYDEARHNKDVTNLKDYHKGILKNGVIVAHHIPEKANNFNVSYHSEVKYVNDPDGFVRRPVKRIIGDLTFQSDNNNNILQISDLVASAFSNLDKNKEKQFFKNYEKMLRRGPDGSIDGYGLKIFPSI